MAESWRNDFAAFFCDLGPRPQGFSLDRIDVNGNYEPGNVRWASTKQQNRNRRDNVLVEWNGEAMTLVELSERLGLKYKRVHELFRTEGHSLPDAIRLATKVK
jgi:hypothetical protein